MRHAKHSNGLGLTAPHRKALMSNMAASLIRHGQIRTTLAKAKILRPFVEKLITLAKKADASEGARSLHFKRVAQTRLRDQAALDLLFTEKVADFRERDGGYTRIYKLGRRTGDAADVAIIALVPADDEGYGKRRKSGGKGKAKAKTGAEEPGSVREEAAADEAAGATEPKAEEVEAEEAAEEKKA
ncbi:MAG: 50S ribosomal protein L17 [Opitutales bacterium]